MIIKTKNKKFLPHAKLIALIACVAIGAFLIGLSIGYSSGWKNCVSFGLHFVDLSGIIDENLIRQAAIHYKSSLGGTLFDESSPFYVGK